jgi:hypothetical protein
MPAGIVASVRKQRLGAWDLDRAEKVVLLFVALEGNAHEAVDFDHGARRAAQKVNGRITGVSNHGDRSQTEKDAPEKAA